MLPGRRVGRPGKFKQSLTSVKACGRQCVSGFGKRLQHVAGPYEVRRSDPIEPPLSGILASTRCGLRKGRITGERLARKRLSSSLTPNSKLVPGSLSFHALMLPARVFCHDLA